MLSWPVGAAVSGGETAFRTLRELKDGVPAGIYEIEGTVAFIYTCPPCPPGAMCKPCMRDNIVLSDAPRRKGPSRPNETRVTVYVFRPKRYKLGRKLRVRVRVLDSRSVSGQAKDVELEWPGPRGPRPF